jgi:hypothetical protein
MKKKAICAMPGQQRRKHFGFDAFVVFVLGGQDVTFSLSQGANGGGGGCFLSIAKDN